MYGKFREMLFPRDVPGKQKKEPISEIFAKYNQGRIEQLCEFKELKSKIGTFPPREPDLLMVSLLQHQAHELSQRISFDKR